ncbi:translation initiation factor 2 [Flintibacter muris]|uniref:translation initiation factor 2 n=1 Tax=Flintibacter muris TaxID=2941327 RepID=UPI00203DC26E|nr:translation initiation factor 2 [Flintibacter muris]
MEQKKNLCAQISLELHQKISEAREESGLTTAQYITNLLIEYYEMKENGGKTTMANNTRTMAFQIPETLFQRIKAHLERETRRTGRKLTQREFVLGLVEAALDEAERQAAEDSPAPEMEEQPSEDAGAGPCEAHPEGSGTQPQEEDDPAALSA